MGRRRAAVSAALALLAALAVVVPAATASGEHRASTGADVGDQLSRTPDRHEHPAGTFQNSIVEAAHTAVEQDGPLGRNPTLPAGFADVRAIDHVSEATAVAFAPDGTAFVALKTGVIKSFDYNSANGAFEDWTTATNFADLTTNVNNYWDRGLTGIALDPQFGTAGHNFVYVNYTYNRDPRDVTPVVPKWGVPGQQYDECPAPATADPPQSGCVVMMRVTRLTAVKNAQGWQMTGTEKELLASGCFQFGSHASGDVAFGPDGKLYASAGEGASFDTLDHGQYLNPCADPGDEGGSLRSQDYRSTSDALGVDGTIVKMDPATGFTPSQATANSWLVAYGQRNPWRLTVRPGTNELWSGDVGGSEWEEVNRIPDVTQVASPINRGWPCYEGSFTGSLVQQGWDALDKPLCESLYPQGLSAVTAPYFSYQTRGPLLTPNEDCQNDTSSVSGIAFGSASSSYPGQYKGAMFFSDYARSCVWVLGKKPNGDPDPTVIQPFVQDAETPVDLVSGPGGDLYYVDYGLDDQGVPTENAAGVHRIVYTGSNAAPTARIIATPTSGAAPLNVSFDGTTSTDPDGDTLTYAWDLDANGSYETTGAKPTKQYAAGTYNVGLRVDDGHGHTSTATQQIQAGNSAPVLGTVTPDPALTWSVGQTVNFSASASDPQQGSLPASAFSWNLAIRHCPSAVCHTHNLSTFSGVSSGSFQAPDHEYPSHLLLTVTVTDSGGLTDSRTVQLDPKTVALSFASSPTGATVTVNSTDHVTPYTETFIQGSRVTITAAPTTGSGASTAAFASWSDGGPRSHELSAPTTATTYTATYPPASQNTAPTVTRVTAYPSGGFHIGQTLGFDAAATDPQQALPDSAYSFAMERQDCDSGCPRVLVRTWTGVGSGQFVVPELPYPSHLYLVATATDAHGATGRGELRIEPRPVALTVRATRKLRVDVDGVQHRNGWSGRLVMGSTVRLVAPRSQRKNGVRWVFVRWSDGGARKHDVTVWDPVLTVKAVYRRSRHGEL
jgi:glucose/arabinose dehydrogenase/PKD repeat protein